MKFRYVVLCWFVLGVAFVFAGEGLLERTWWGLVLCLVCGLALGRLVKHEMEFLKRGMES